MLASTHQDRGLLASREGPALQFHTATTRAALAWLTHAMLDAPRKDAKFKYEAGMAEKLLRRVLRAAARRGGFQVVGPEDVCCFFLDRECRVSLASLAQHAYESLAKLAQRLVAYSVDDAKVDLISLIREFYAVAHAPSRFRGSGPRSRLAVGFV